LYRLVVADDRNVAQPNLPGVVSRQDWWFLIKPDERTVGRIGKRSERHAGCGDSIRATSEVLEILNMSGESRCPIRLTMGGLERQKANSQTD
jgi:hypothetical protein